MTQTYILNKLTDKSEALLFHICTHWQDSRFLILSLRIIEKINICIHTNCYLSLYTQHFSPLNPLSWSSKNNSCYEPPPRLTTVTCYQVRQCDVSTVASVTSLLSVWRSHAHQRDVTRKDSVTLSTRPRARLSTPSLSSPTSFRIRRCTRMLSWLQECK